MRLDKLGYRGDYSFEVFNDDYQQMPMERVCARAFRAAEWLGEDVLRHSVPLPNRMRLKSYEQASAPPEGDSAEDDVAVNDAV
jgi:hypothetical protein